MKLFFQNVNKSSKRLSYSQRLYSSKRQSLYSHTVKTPKTNFPLSLENVFQRELQIQKESNFEGLYEWQNKSKRLKTFVLHDGPPYANGKVHVGHALNKILKDIINRYKLLRGYKVVYKPGWDCHGTPIEQKALSHLGKNADSLEALEIRKLASKFARECSKEQKESFKLWGVMADWENGCYYTFDPQYETKQLEAFFRLYEKGYVFQQYMPIFWSPSSKTALAESEIEYVENYKSTQVFLKMPVKSLSFLPEVGRTYVLIWTTTPWTLPLNKAVCYGDGVRYVLVEAADGDKYIISEKFKQELEALLKSPVKLIHSFEGSQLENSCYISTNGEEAPFLAGSHVTSDKGTGLVHTAPAHGVEDFQVALKHGLSLDCCVDEEGRYTKEAGKDLEGKHVIEEGSQYVLEKLKNQIIHQSPFEHSYPHDWRSKQPIIFRASKQWFIDTKRIKNNAMEGVNRVNSQPKSCQSAMRSNLEGRNYWCISRQRFWGVPIPVFYNKTCGSPIINRDIIEHLKALFKQHGSDCWWKMDLKKLFPHELRNKLGIKDEVEKGRDILDIWFDSGVSWFCVSEEEVQSDVYLEGLDQYGGWFMSSLLTSTALQSRPPFKNLLVHGFAMDEQGRKMSKSLGNVVNPADVVQSGENNESYGVDVLRTWVGSSGLDPSVSIGKNVLEEAKQKLFRLRKSLRYMVGCLYDYSGELNNFDIKSLHLTDQYVLHQLTDLIIKVSESYDTFNISRVSRLIDHFNSNRLSAFYFHLVKDRLYCGDKVSRASAQHCMHHLLYSLCKLTAPITPHLSEEVFSYHPMKLVSSSVFKTSDWLKAEWQNQKLATTYETVQPIRQAFYQTVGFEKPGVFELDIWAKEDLMRELKFLHHPTNHHTSALCELMGAATVNLQDSVVEPSQLVTKDFEDFTIRLKRSEKHKCLRCRRNLSIRNALCGRCVEVLNEENSEEKKRLKTKTNTI